MNRESMKKEIEKRIETMDLEQLAAAYKLFMEWAEQEEEKDIPFDHPLADEKIEQGLRQLDGGEYADFGLFLREMKTKYGKGE